MCVLDPNQKWTAKRFVRAGFPYNPLPADRKVHGTISEESLNLLRKEREEVLPFSLWEEKLFNTILDWAVNGVPDDGPVVPAAEGKHNLTPDELKLTLDKLATFASKGFLFGPLDKADWPTEELGEPHKIGIFLRHQKGSGSMRVITNCSAPAKQSINDYNNINVQRCFPYNMATPSDVINLILGFSSSTVLQLTKCDLGDAFKMLPIKIKAWFRQIIELNCCFFLDNRLLFGDNTAAHYFVTLNYALQLLFVFPVIKAPATLLKLAIDDSTLVASKISGICAAYSDRYKLVCSRLGLNVKPNDENREKAFDPTEEDGQVLGINLLLKNRTWRISEEKMNHVSEVIDMAADPKQSWKIVLMTLKEVQQVVGLLLDFAKLSHLLKTLCLVPAAERNFWTEEFSQENRLRSECQSRLCWFSHHARKNILFIRAILLSTNHCPLPMEISNYRRRPQAGAQVVLYCDASGEPKEVVDGKYYPTCLGSYRPATVRCSVSTLKAFVLPYSWLVSTDRRGKVYFHTAMLELMPLLCELLDEPDFYYGKSIRMFTDNQATVAIFENQNPAGLYTAFMLETVNLVIMALNVRVKISWLPRRSSYPMNLADDATHATMRHAKPGVKCTRQHLPPPLYNVLHSAQSYPLHDLDRLRREVKKYLLLKFPRAQFPM